MTTDEITTEYHPNSRRPPETQPFEEYGRKRQFFSPPPSAEPWRPFFNTREDFVFAEILMEARVDRDRSDRLIKLIKLCLDGKGALTFSNYSDVLTAWECAASQLTPVSLNIHLRAILLTLSGTSLVSTTYQSHTTARPRHSPSLFAHCGTGRSISS